MHTGAWKHGCECSWYRGTPVCECTPVHGNICVNAHRGMGVPVQECTPVRENACGSARWCVGTTMCAQVYGSTCVSARRSIGRLASAHRGVGAPVCGCPVIPWGGSQLIRRLDGGAEDGRTTGTAPFRVPSGEPCGRRSGFTSRQSGWRAACCGYSMRHWVLFPLWGRKGGRGCPALGPQAATWLFWVHLVRLPRGALQMCPPHQALGL